MLDILIWILIGILLALGFISCFINKIPGPMLLFIGILVAQIGFETGPGWGAVAIVAAIAIAAFILSKVITRVAKKMQEYSKKASVATTIASLIGLILMAGAGSNKADNATIIMVIIVGFIVLPFLFAFLVESIRQKSVALGAKSATAATIAYLADTALKLGAFAYAIYAMFMNK